jgi:GNAT superfamily N-acetyltransferase
VTSPTPDAGVRPARPDDAEAIGAVHARAWQVSYAELLPDRADAALAPESLAASWREAVVDPPSREHRVLVATAGPQVVGFAALSPAGDADTDPTADAELVVLLIDPERTHQGHGSRLLNASADTLRDRGFQRVIAWVPEPDGDRKRFLQDAGFAADGGSRLLDAAGDGTTTVREVRLSASLSLAT